MFKPISVEEAQEGLHNFQKWFAAFEKQQGRKLGKQTKKALRKHLEITVAEGRLVPGIRHGRNPSRGARSPGQPGERTASRTKPRPKRDETTEGRQLQPKTTGQE